MDSKPLTAEEIAKKVASQRQFRDDLVARVREGFDAGLKHEPGNGEVRCPYTSSTPFSVVYREAARLAGEIKAAAIEGIKPGPVEVHEMDLSDKMEACLNEVDLLAGKVQKVEDRLTMAEEDPLKARAPKFFDDLLQLFRESMAPQISLAVPPIHIPKGGRRVVGKKAKKV